MTTSNPSPFVTRRTILAGLGAGGLGLAFAASGGGRGAPTTVGAPASPAAATPDADALLFAVTLPAAGLPVGDDAGSGLGYFVIPSSTMTTWAPSCCLIGPMVDYVISGSYTVRAEAAVRVVRADGAVEDVPAGTEVVVAAGESLITRYETGMESGNAGTEPLELLNWILIGGDDGFPEDTHPGFVDGAGRGPLVVRDAPLLVELRPIVVRGGDDVPAPAAGYHFIVSTTANVFATENDDSTFRIAGTPGETSTLYVISFQPVGAAAATPEP